MDLLILSNHHIHLNSPTCGAFNKCSFENSHKTEPNRTEDCTKNGTRTELSFFRSWKEPEQNEFLFGRTRTKPNSSSEGSFPSLVTITVLSAFRRTQTWLSLSRFRSPVSPRRRVVTPARPGVTPARCRQSRVLTGARAVKQLTPRSSA